MNSKVTAALFLLLISATQIRAQQEVEQDYTAFVQSVNIESWRGGEFRLSAKVRVDRGTKFSHVRLWARIDTKKSMGFFDNMADRPILAATWKTYTIEGPVDAHATRLVAGGICFGADRYYFDDFQVEVRHQGGSWEKLPLINAGFEEKQWTSGWKATQQVKGFVFGLSEDDKQEGSRSLVIDARSRPTDSRFIDANGISIHYKESGAGDTVIFLHGNNESLRSFDEQLPEFSRTFHVIALDSRGQGYTTEDGTPLTYELMAEDVKAFMDAKGIGRAHLVGWSDGGNIGLIVAMKYPGRVASLSTMGANLYNNETSVDPAINRQVRNIRDRLVAMNRPSNRFQIELCDLLLTQPNLRPEDLRAIRCPVLVMAGSKDVIKEPHTRLIASSIPGSKLIIFPKGTHDEPRENPKRFNATIISFLDSLGSQ
jgi:pimeloyl-ACP methyl ester carboxylesterase